MATDDEEFERAVSHYIQIGMPRKHRLSVIAYRRKCKLAWDACKSDEKYQTKVLLDHLWTQLTVPELGKRAYIDDATWGSFIDREKPTKKITCIAVGRVPFLKNDRGAPTANHRSPRYLLSGTDFWITALFDVLGFKAAYQRLGIEKLYGLYQTLIDKIILSSNIDSFSTAQRIGDITLVNHFRLWIGFHYFSDTILLWCPATPENISPFLTRCSDLFVEALNVGLPLRGAISIGEANFNKRTGIFIGQPLIDCAQLESSQNWLGVALSKSCSGILEHIDSDLILPYTPPIKPSGDGSAGSLLHAGAVLDWPRRARSITSVNITATIDALNTSPSHRLYYDNTTAFVRHSAANARWNRDEKILVIFDALRNALVSNRLATHPMPGWALTMIRTLETQKEYGPSVGNALRRAATENLAPAEIERLPSGPRQFLTEVESIVEGRAVDLVSLTIGTVEARFGICDLDSHYKQVLDNPEDYEHIKSSLFFLRALLSNAAIPDIPGGISAAEKRILSMARTFAAGESLPINIENFLAAVMYSSITGTALESDDQKRLQFIAAKGEPWSQLADAIKSVLTNDPIHVSHEILPAEVATTVQVLKTFVGNRRREFHAANHAIARAQENVDINVLRRLVECLQRRDEQPAQDELGAILKTMDGSGHPHDTVARFVRVLLTKSEEITIPGGISREVHWFLQLLTRIVGQGDWGIPIDLIGRMIANVRAGRAGGDWYGMALFGTLMSDEGEGLLFKEFFESLISTKGLPPIPDAVNEDTARAMETMLRLLQREDVWIELRDTAHAVANSRLQGVQLDECHVMHIRAISQSDEPFASFARWLDDLRHGSEELPLPNGLPSHIIDYLDVWRLKAIARCSLEAVMELRRVALRCRLQREKFSESHLKTMESLLRAGGIYEKLAIFIRKLSKPHAIPPVPMGLPPGILIAFASARREALWQEGAGLILPHR